MLRAGTESATGYLGCLWPADGLFDSNDAVSNSIKLADSAIWDRRCDFVPALVHGVSTADGA